MLICLCTFYDAFLCVHVTKYVNGNINNISLYLRMYFLGSSGTGLCSECYSSYAGANCDISVPAVIIPSLLIMAVLATAIFFLSSWYLKR